MVYDNICKVVPLYSPELMSEFLNNMSDALILSSNLCSGKPWTFKEFKNSVGCKLSFILSLQFSLLTISALYIVIIGVSSQNLLMVIELIVLQSQFSGVRIALSFSGEYVRKNLSCKSVWGIWHLRWYEKIIWNSYCISVYYSF